MRIVELSVIQEMDDNMHAQQMENKLYIHRKKSLKIMCNNLRISILRPTESKTK